MKIIKILLKTQRFLDGDGVDGILAEELQGDIAEYLAAYHGEWSTFDDPDPELVREVEKLFGIKTRT